MRGEVGMSGEFAVERIIWLHKRIKDGYYPNAVRLSERFGISHRQAQRDCDYLRRKLNAPVEFDRSRQGYYYTEPFSLPDSIRVEDPRDISNIVALADMLGGNDGESTQISIPYTALLQIPDKLAALELAPFVTKRVGSKGKYICEFQNIRVFFGALIASDAEIRILEPEWLREDFCRSLDRLRAANEKSAEEEEQENGAED
jgi:predicted DNA-binding transcriptional regulator YafY